MREVFDLNRLQLAPGLLMVKTSSKDDILMSRSGMKVGMIKLGKCVVLTLIIMDLVSLSFIGEQPFHLDIFSVYLFIFSKKKS